MKIGLLKEEKIPVVKKAGRDFLYGKGQYEKIEFKEIMSPYQKHFFVNYFCALMADQLSTLQSNSNLNCQVAVHVMKKFCSQFGAGRRGQIM